MNQTELVIFGVRMMIVITKGICAVVLLFLCALPLGGVRAGEASPGQPGQMLSDPDLMADREYLVSECKRISMGWNGSYALDGKSVRVFTKGTYVVVYFFPQDSFTVGGDTTFYFAKKSKGEYEFIKAVLG